MLAFLHLTARLLTAEKGICLLFLKFIPYLHDTVLMADPVLALHRLRCS